MSKSKNKCIICQSNKLLTIHNFGNQPPSNNYKTKKNTKDYLHKLILAKCAKCHLVQILKPIPLKRVVPKYSWISYREQEGHLDKLFNDLKDTLKKDNKILGVTSKDNTFIERFKRNGFKKIKELDKQKDFFLSSKFCGLETIQNLFNIKFSKNFIRKNGHFDILICRHFLEHSRSPLKLINSFKMIINNSGYMLIEVPDNKKIFKNSNFFFIWEEHMSYFTNISIENLFKLANLKIISKYKFKYIHEDSLVYLLSINNKPNQLVKFKKEKNFTNLFNRKIINFHKLIYKYRNRNIVLLGAGHIAIRFINFYKLSKLLKFVIDDDLNKIGKYLPKSNLKIEPSAKLYKTKIDLCISTLNEESDKKFKKNNNLLFKSGLKIVNIFK